MQVDISALTATELDELISKAMYRRAELQPPVPTEVPQIAAALENPQWFCSGQPGGTLWQVRHPGLGWLAFFIPRVERAQLMALILQQALHEPYQPAVGAAATATPGRTAGGGGAVH